MLPKLPISVIKKSICLKTNDLLKCYYETNAVAWTIDNNLLMDVLFKKINKSNQINLQLNYRIV